MSKQAFVPYAPLNALKPFAPDLWVVDGPEIGFRYTGVTVPFPTRMTIARLPSGDLWVHSPIAWDDALGTEITRLGRVRHLVAPNSIHYWYLPEWQARFPDAASYGVPGLAKTARRQLSLDETLGDTPPATWEGAFEQGIVAGRILTEADFLHRASRTLILTDLIENFEPQRVRAWWLRLLMRIGGVLDPDGKAPIDMQWSFRRNRKALRAAVQRMIGWEPERIIVAHGRCYERDGPAELRRAFRWAL